MGHSRVLSMLLPAGPDRIIRSRPVPRQPRCPRNDAVRGALARLERHHDVDDVGLSELRRARDDLVGERTTGEDRFEAVAGPFRRYQRVLQVRPGTVAGRWSVDERIDFTLAVPVWGLLLILPVRRGLRHPRHDGRQPWWAPPGRLDPAEARTLGLLATLALVPAYLGTLLGQTLTFATDSFGAGTGAYSIVLAVVRVGVLGTLVATTAADRLGRRRLLRGCLLVACLVMATASVAPNLWWFGSAQAIARGLTAAGEVIVVILAVEEMPTRSRAWAVSVLTLAAGLGSGMVVWLLPLTDLGPEAWRLLYLPPLAFFVVVLWAARHLPESRRFMAAADAAGAPRLSGVRWADIDRRTRRRMALLAGSAILSLAFTTPASQFANDFLKDERHMSGGMISLFTLATSTPAAIGIYVGSRLAETVGRRRIGAVGLIMGTGFAVAGYLTFGAALWITNTLATIAAGMVLPALRVYQPELFPTRLRGRANGLITLAGVAGSVTGVLLVGALAERWGSISWPMAVLAAGPLAVSVLVLTVYPETAGRTLEELHPGDAPPPEQPGRPEVSGEPYPAT